MRAAQRLLVELGHGTKAHGSHFSKVLCGFIGLVLLLVMAAPREYWGDPECGCPGKALFDLLGPDCS